MRMGLHVDFPFVNVQHIDVCDEYVIIDSVGIRIHSQIERQHVIEHFQYLLFLTCSQQCIQLVN